MQGKIINDPVYGFIRFPEPEMMQLIDHPWFQRLRNIKQMGTASYVYPGAMHTRFHHSLGTAHLMGIALGELKNKGIEIEAAEHLAARQAILLHDIGHGPYSHALESSLINISHEEISTIIIRSLNQLFGGQLSKAISIFQNTYPKPFLHQLVSSQLDMDRMDYLNRDSFYSGVSEGVIGYHRILQMLTVTNNELVVEEKGIHSVEKFIIARQLMYWQVYLHKTVLGSEQLLIHILKRAKTLAQKGKQLFATPDLLFFLYENVSAAAINSDEKVLQKFCNLYDDDVLSAIKVWQQNSDFVLSKLSKMLINRRLYKTKLSIKNFESEVEELKTKAKHFYDEESIPYFIFSGKTSNSAYNQEDERINILMKTGELQNISQVENSLINAFVAKPIDKYFLCCIPEVLKGTAR